MAQWRSFYRPLFLSSCKSVFFNGQPSFLHYLSFDIYIFIAIHFVLSCNYTFIVSFTLEVLNCKIQDLLRCEDPCLKLQDYEAEISIQTQVSLYCERFEPRSHFTSRMSLSVRVNLVLNRTVVVDSD